MNDDILYLVKEGCYSEYDSGNDLIIAVFSTQELARTFILKLMPYLSGQNYIEKYDNYWRSQDQQIIEIQEVPLDINYIPADYLPCTPNKL